MAVTNELSTQLSATLAALNEQRTYGGKLRVLSFDFTQGVAAGDATSTQGLVKLPAGKVRVLAHLSRLEFSAFGAARTLDVGNAAYTQPDGTAGAAAAAVFASAVDVSAAGSTNFGEASVQGDGGVVDFNSRTGVVIQSAVAGGTIPAGATLNGYLVYVQD